MSNYSELMNNSELSLASYSNLTVGNINAGLLRDMAVYEKDNFVSRFDEFVAIHPNTDSGFSATVFKSSDGQLTVAIRGTEGVNGDDLHADNHITQYGAAYNQIVDMYNWWKQVSITAGTELDQ